MALYKTTTDQNVDTTQRDLIHHWDLPCGLLDLVENFTELIVSVRKKWAFNILSTLNLLSLYTFFGEIHLNTVSKVYLHKL